jgi:glutamyl-tRNA synthetase
MAYLALCNSATDVWEDFDMSKVIVVDDFEMGVTHIIRGEDGIYNTPRQILIQEAISAPRPIYAHMPFILNEDRSKLSKRS